MKASVPQIQPALVAADPAPVHIQTFTGRQKFKPQNIREIDNLLLQQRMPADDARDEGSLLGLGMPRLLKCYIIGKAQIFFVLGRIAAPLLKTSADMHVAISLGKESFIMLVQSRVIAVFFQAPQVFLVHLQPLCFSGFFPQCHLPVHHPFTAPAASPDTTCFCSRI
ncbi:hypothetical protein D3C73_579390 [compost metagenome]